MERELIGTVGIAMVASLVIASFIIPRSAEDGVRILKNDFPPRLVAAASDSVGENAFTLGFALARDFLNVQVRYRFLYEYNLSAPGGDSPEDILRRISILRRIVPDLACDVEPGSVIYNGTECSYMLYDFGEYGYIPRESGQSAFLIVERDSEIVACFSGPADLFPRRSEGSLLDVTLTRTGNRTYYSKQSLEQTWALPVPDVPAGGFEFLDVRRDETIEISFRSDAFYTRPHYAGAVQVVSLICDGKERALLLNFIE